MLPALNYAEHDRIQERLSVEEERRVVDITRELLTETAPAERGAPTRAEQAALETEARAGNTVALLGYPANGEADEVALRMLARVLEGTPLVLEVLPGPALSSELVELVKAKAYGVVCIADLPPSPPSKSRYLVKRLRAALPDVKVIVGRWAPAAFADDTIEPLLQAGADQVTTSLLETREHLSRLLHLLPSEGTPDAA